MIQEFALVPLVEEFIKKSNKGRRLKTDGKKLRVGTVENYKYLLLHLKRFQETENLILRIRSLTKLTKPQLVVEQKYWKRFYGRFTDYLYKNEYHDNAAGLMIKNLRAVFNWIEREKLINVGKFHKDFYVVKEEIPVITLMPDQLHFLINNQEFEDRLTDSLKICKDIFVLGCTVALRFSDLINLQWKSIQMLNGSWYLVVNAQKTNYESRVKLPQYAVEILAKFKRGKKNVFPYISLAWFNKRIQKLCELAGWTHVIGKARSRRGVQHQVLNPKTGKSYRFCDVVSSHVMRKTAITTMLMHKVPETVVRKISGHTGDSKAFYRYVNVVQSYLDIEVDKHFDRLIA